MSLGKFRLAEGTQLSLEVEHLGSLSSTHQNSAQIEKHETIQKLKDRDPVFLKALFKDMNPRLLKLSASHGVYTEAAEELVHECWETFFTNLGKFEGRSTNTDAAPSDWIMRRIQKRYLHEVFQAMVGG